MELPNTADRVQQHTSDETNHALRLSTKSDLEYYRAHPDEIDRRLRELDKEWDVERTLGANASSVILIGLGLAVFVSRRFLFLPSLAAGFLLQHALQGWCPPLPILRRLGFRTQSEIEGERRGLKTIRKRVRDGREDYRETPAELPPPGTQNHDEKLLDESIKETLPASDPPATTAPGSSLSKH